MVMRLRVLIIDHHLLLAEALAGRFMRAGMTVAVARTAAEAAILCHERPFDVAVVDANLGEADGVLLATELLACGLVQGVVFHGGATDPERRARAEAVGAFVPKGSAPHRVIDQVRRASWPRSEAGLAVAVTAEPCPGC